MKNGFFFQIQQITDNAIIFDQFGSKKQFSFLAFKLIKIIRSSFIPKNQ